MVFNGGYVSSMEVPQKQQKPQQQEKSTPPQLKPHTNRKAKNRVILYLAVQPKDLQGVHTRDICIAMVTAA